jgi:hypothetical protein
MLKSPKHLWAVYAKDETSSDLHEINYEQLGRAVHGYARKLRAQIGDKKDVVVSILATVDTLTYQAIMVRLYASSQSNR